MRRGDVTIASEKRYMFLFNDLCLVAKPDSKGINYQFKYSLFTYLILSLSLVISIPRSVFSFSCRYVVELSRASLEESPRAKHPVLLSLPSLPVGLSTISFYLMLFRRFFICCTNIAFFILSQEVTFDLQTVDRPYQIVCRNSAEKMAW